MAEITAALVKDLRDEDRRGHDGLQEGADRRPAATWRPRSTGCARRACRPPPRSPAASPPRAWSASPPPPAAAAMVEVNAETDFVARNETFQDFVATVAKIALDGRRRPRGDQGRAVPRHRPHGGRGTDPPRRHHRREHDHPPRQAARRCAQGVVATYVHNALKPGLGKIGVLVARRGRRASSTRWRRSAGRSACTSPPRGPTRSTSTRVDPAALEREKCGADRAGARLRQARGDHREDGRRPHPQILRGSGAAGAGLGA